MAVPHASSGFGDLVDPRVKKLFYDEYKKPETKLNALFSMEKSNDQYETWSGVGATANFPQFTGSVSYQDQFQGYDTTATHVEFASGIQIERSLYDDDRHNLWERRPVALAQSALNTREGHGARIFNLGFSVDSFFYNNSENVALFSNSHTTTSGASTAIGFDNLRTAALSYTALVANKIDMANFRDDQANRLQIRPDTLLIPVDLCDIAYEAVKSMGKPDTDTNNRSYVYDQGYKIIEWIYLTDVNNWFMLDSTAMKRYLVWWDRVPLEFAFAEEIDTIIAKWRAYMRYSNAWYDWRFALGNQVS